MTRPFAATAARSQDSTRPDTGLESTPDGPEEGANPDAVDRAYARLAPLYDLIFGRALAPGRRAMASSAAALKPGTLLEVGVGSGLTLDLYPIETHVCGIDLSEPMLKRARDRADSLSGRRIELQRMNAEQMDFPDGSFDCVTVPYVLNVTPDPNRLIREIRRVCKPGGTILIVNHFSGHSAFWRVFDLAIRRVARRIGWRPDFDYAAHIPVHDWQIVSVRAVNMLGLSTMIEIRNAPSASGGPAAV